MSTSTVNTKKFIFKIDFITPEETITLLNRDMLFPQKQRHPQNVKHNKPTLTENVLENSVEATLYGQEIAKLVRMVLKNTTMDYMEKYQYSDNYSKPYDTTNCYYRIYLVDTNYPVYNQNGTPVMDGDNPVYQNMVIFNVDISAQEYIYNPNFIPPFNKIWKDFSHINDLNPNSEYKEDGVTKRTMRNGIRSIIKDLLSLQKYSNRFKQNYTFDDSYCAFASEVGIY